jgi:hypothetical protein
MKSLISVTLFLFLINFTSLKKETQNIPGISYEIVIGQNMTKIKMILSTSTTNHTLFSNSNRKYAYEIQDKRNKSTLIDTITFNEIPIPELKFNVKIDPTNFNDQTIQGELGFGINLNGKNEFIELLYKDKIIFQKEIIIGAELILDTYLVTDKYYFGNLTDRDDLDAKYQQGWICELSHILTGTSEKEFVWNNTEEINGRVLLDSSSKYIFAPENYINLMLDIWNLNLTKCPIVEDDDKTYKYIKCTKIAKDYFSNIKPIFFIIDGYAFLLTAEELFENIGNDNYESFMRFRKENHNIWTFGSPFFKKYKVWMKYDKKLIGFNGENIIDFHKEYKVWREENEFILNKESNDKKIVVIGAVMGSMILLTILYCLIKSFKTENSRNSSKFIEEQKFPNI